MNCKIIVSDCLLLMPLNGDIKMHISIMLAAAFLVTMATMGGQRVCREPGALQRRITLERSLGGDPSFRSGRERRWQAFPGKRELHKASKRTVSLSAGQERKFKDSEVEALKTCAESWKHMDSVMELSRRPFQD